MDAYEVDREDLILLLLDAHERLSGQAELKGMTRLEKLVFLLSREEDSSAARQFSFAPYKYGPFSKDIYETIDSLYGLGFVERHERPVMSPYESAEEQALLEESGGDEESEAVVREKILALTDNGRKVANELRKIWIARLPQELRHVEEAIKRYASLPLNQLIRYVYRRFPETAANSVHPEARRLAEV